MTSGKCYQQEMTYIQIHACAPFLPKAIIQNNCGAMLVQESPKMDQNRVQKAKNANTLNFEKP